MKLIFPFFILALASGNSRYLSTSSHAWSNMPTCENSNFAIKSYLCAEESPAWYELLAMLDIEFCNNPRYLADGKEQTFWSFTVPDSQTIVTIDCKGQQEKTKELPD